MESLDWEHLRFGVFSQPTTKAMWDDKEWKCFLTVLSGVPVSYRYKLLDEWVDKHCNTMKSRIQVTAYVNGLKKAGMLK